MKCPECDFVQSDQNTKCSKCGFVLEKYQGPQASTLRKGGITAKRENAAGDGTFFQKTVFFVESEVNPFHFGGRIVVGLIIFKQYRNLDMA